MAIAFNFAARSDVGMVRSDNEDSAYAGPHLLALADGMGGHAGGDVASSVVVGNLAPLDGESFSGVDATEALLDRITSANIELGALADEDAELAGMGTTLVAILRARDKLVLAHIGDSRAFVIRNGSISQITKDHSFVQSLVDEGRLTPDEAINHPQRSLVTRVLTGGTDEEPDVVVRQAVVGDRYLICSDGLSDYVALDTIAEVVANERGPDACAERLVQLALRAGAPDNVTVIVGDIVDLTKGPVPSDAPRVVGAAAVRQRHTTAFPLTPAAKAAALRKKATGTDESDELPLAEEGPRGLRSTVVRGLGALLLAAIVLVGGSYAAWSWLRTQLFVGIEGGRVVVFTGMNQKIGPMQLYSTERTTTIRAGDLPEFYRDRLAAGITQDTQAATDALVRNLEVQARACRWAKSQNRACATVPPDWTRPSPTPPTPSPTATPSSTGTPSSTVSSPPPAPPVRPT